MAASTGVINKGYHLSACWGWTAGACHTSGNMQRSSSQAARWWAVLYRNKNIRFIMLGVHCTGHVVHRIYIGILRSQQQH